MSGILSLMGMMQEFKEFAVKGNAIDLAVGVVIGAAFGKIVNSIVEDIINPLVGLLMGGTDLTGYFALLSNPKGGTYTDLASAKASGAAVLAYGNLINNIVQFVIIAFAIFIVVKQANRLTRVSGENLPK